MGSVEQNHHERTQPNDGDMGSARIVPLAHNPPYTRLPPSRTIQLHLTKAPLPPSTKPPRRLAKQPVLQATTPCGEQKGMRHPSDGVRRRRRMALRGSSSRKRAATQSRPRAHPAGPPHTPPAVAAVRLNTQKNGRCDPATARNPHTRRTVPMIPRPSHENDTQREAMRVGTANDPQAHRQTAVCWRAGPEKAWGGGGTTE